MNPELNREYPEPDETRLNEEMVAVAVARMKLQDERMRRGQHAKATGCVRGVFTIRDDVPEELRYGVFRQPKQSFQAVLRFSNSAETMDSDKTVAARGTAIKLLDVKGAPAIPGAGQCCQDFLAVNLPVFPFATPTEYVKFFDIRTTPVGDLLAGAWFALFHPAHVTSVTELAAETVASLRYSK
ncbi:MAG: catalase [Caldilinea sp.]